ncbi:nucleoside-diphosphate kinase [Candidatus Neomarinimicrobiota bacterium]
MDNRTLAIIKPDAVQNGFLGKILDRIVDEKFQILGAKLISLSKDQAERFYFIHKGKSFYEELTAFMSSGPCMVLALKKDNAVDEWRSVIGATNPVDADEGTIRKEFASDLGKNAVHGSDNDENAKIEIGFFFPEANLIY